MPELGGVPDASWAGGEDSDMDLGEVGMGVGEVGEHALEGEFGGVVGAAEVGEPEPAHAIGAPGLQYGFCCLIVGEVAGGAEDALLEVIGVGAAQESFAVVV